MKLNSRSPKDACLLRKDFNEFLRKEVSYFYLSYSLVTIFIYESVHVLRKNILNEAMKSTYYVFNVNLDFEE